MQKRQRRIVHVFHYFLSTEENDQDPGITDPGGRGCGIQLGGVAAPGHCSEEPVPGCDGGKL